MSGGLLGKEIATAGESKAGSKTAFVHLHNHSHYSLLDGLQKVPELLDRAVELGMPAVALTDHGTLSGSIEFYNEAKKRGIKPIIGLETYVAPRTHTDKAGKIDANPYHLILLAMNLTGYHNLMRLTSRAHLEGYYYKPRVDRQLLEQYNEGLIALSACAGGEVATHIRNGAMDQAEAVVRWYQSVFGDRYYLELQDHEDQWEVQRQINQAKLELGQKTGVKCVVTADCHYARHTDKEAHEMLLCVQTGKTIGDSDRMTMEMDLFMSSGDDIAARWTKHPEVVSESVRIAERCEFVIEQGKILIPRFAVPAGQTEQTYLRQLTWQGLMWRYGGIAKEDMGLVTEDKARATLAANVVERAEFELGVIENMGFSGYFLIVADFVNWGKNQGIIFGPGRGSAAGSIIAYSLNITDLDPIHYDLLFERFLNPDRISMPDMDIDIQDSRRDEVIQYVTEKYGQAQVAQIITFGTMAARAAIRDTGRALGYPYDEVDRIAKLVPPPVQGRHIPLAKSIQDDPDLKQEYTTNPRATRLIDLASRLEGTIRSNGVHAAGVVIAPAEIVRFIPLQRAQKGGITTQYDMNVVESLGLLKMDFLGLSNLTIIKNALRIIKKVYNHSIEISELPLDDAKTFQLLQRGDTTGVFQLESAGMKRYLRELKPTVLEDIVAMVALYRPGPMQWIDEFVDRKHGRRKIEYLHPAMESALKSTYGVLVYQEQVMQIAKEMAGFTGGQADTLRKAIGKKIPEVMKKMKSEFIEGAIKNSGIDRSVVEKFWASLEDFAAYCFNKSHAACYALIAYQTAYLKAHYPAAFMAALMTSDHDNIERIAIEVTECQRMGMRVLPPDVNESYREFSVVPETGMIRFGLSAVKNVGTGAIEALLEAREKDGPFSSIEDFAKRVSASEVNKKVWESLVKAGAFDNLGERSQLMFNLDLITGYASKAQKNALSGQIDIFGSLGQQDNLPTLHLDTPPTVASNRESLAWEKELLGLYLSHHPLDEYEAYLAAKSMRLGEVTADMEGKTVKVGGITTTVRRILTKNNDAMAFVGLEDKTGALELIVFPRAYAEQPDIWQPDMVLIATGKVSTKDRDGKVGGEIKILIDSAKVVDYDVAKQYRGPVPPPKMPAETEEPALEAAETHELPTETATAKVPAALEVKLADLADNAQLVRIKDILDRYPGESQVILAINGTKRIRLPKTVSTSDKLIAELEAELGAGSAVTLTPA